MPDNNFDRFVESINESGFQMNSELKKKILNRTLKKIKFENSANAVKAGKPEARIFSLKNIAASLLAIFIIAAVIPDSPVNALCQKIFSFIPGVGVVRDETGERLIKGALNEPVRVTDKEEFLEVKSAYMAGNALHVTINTNIGVNRINTEDKEEVLKYFSGETMPGIYLLVNGQKIKLDNYSTGSPSLETKAYTIKGSFYLDGSMPADVSFGLSMDGFGKTVEFKLSPVKNGVTPEAMGSTITVDDIMIFANTGRSGGIYSVELSTVAPKAFRSIRFYLFDTEKAMFTDSIYVLDENNVKYLPDEGLRKLNNSGVNTFYFRIPDDRKIDRIVLPQILYSRDCKSEIKIKMPEIAKAVNINRRISFGGSSILINRASVVPKNDRLLPEDFKKYDCLKIEYSAGDEDKSNEKILRIIPDIEVPDSAIGYRLPSSSVYSELCPLDENEGYALVVFDDMDKTRKIMINLEIEFAVIGPFEMEAE